MPPSPEKRKIHCILLYLLVNEHTYDELFSAARDLFGNDISDETINKEVVELRKRGLIIERLEMFEVKCHRTKPGVNMYRTLRTIFPEMEPVWSTGPKTGKPVTVALAAKYPRNAN